MSITLNSLYVQTSLTKVLALYKAVVLPRLSKILKPPKHLRHIPYLGYFDLINALVKRESYWDHAFRSTLPFLKSTQVTNGIYMRPGPLGWDIHVTNPDDAKHVLFKFDVFPKAYLFEGLQDTFAYKFNGGQSFFFTNGHDWKSQKSLANPAFRRPLPVKLFGQLTSKLINKMDEMDETKEVSNLMRRLTIDIIGKAAFGYDFKAIQNEQSERVTIYNIINKAVQDPLYFAFPSLDTKLLQLVPKRKVMFDRLEDFVAMLNKVIASKREDMKNGKLLNGDLEKPEKDILTLFIEAEESGEGIMTSKMLNSNVTFFFLAGHETTSNALSSALYYLAVHPDIQQRARKEAIAILGNEPFDLCPTMDQLKDMRFVSQVVKETLRMNSPAVELIPRVAQQDTVLSGTFIPKGSLITIDIFNIHHNEKVWKNQDKFNPDRFADDGEDAIRSSGEGLTWLPFSSGARQCLGMNMSLIEQRVVISMLLRKYIWSLPEDSIHKGYVKNFGSFLVGPYDLNITFKKRY